MCSFSWLIWRQRLTAVNAVFHTDRGADVLLAGVVQSVQNHPSPCLQSSVGAVW